MIQEPTLLGSGFDHRQDAGLQGLGQSGPSVYEGDDDSGRSMNRSREPRLPHGIVP